MGYTKTTKIKPLPHMCYHADFGPSASMGIDTNTGEPQKLPSPGTLLYWDERRG